MDRSQGLPERVAERDQAEDGDDAEHGGHGLPEADGPRDRGAAEHERRQQRQLDAPGLPALDAISA